MTLEEEVRRILNGENRKTYWEDLLEDLVSALKAMAIGVGGVLCVMVVLGLMVWPPAQPFFEAVVFELIGWIWQLFESEPSYPVLVEEYSVST